VSEGARAREEEEGGEEGGAAGFKIKSASSLSHSWVEVEGVTRASII
jgi:hypothetical protein